MLASRRTSELPPEAFATLAARIAQLRDAGCTVIDLGRADPDHATPEPVVAALLRAAPLPEHHHYPSFPGLPALRRSVARWYAERHDVALDPNGEVLITGGAKAGLFHLALGICDPGDVALVPDPSFPAYRVGAYFAGAEVVSMPLRPERGYLPDLASIPEAVARRARLLFLNYPNNPTGATAPLCFLADAVAFARRHGILLCHDLAYGESGYDGYRAPSLLRVEGAKEVAVEFISWSTAFCMPGWRLGAAVGNPRGIGALQQVETQVNAGVFSAVQVAGGVALDQVGHSGFLTAMQEGYRDRRDQMVAVLQELGVRVRRPQATPFLWFPCPDARPSAEYAAWLLERTGVALAPGSAFGAAGEGFLRLSLTAAAAEMDEAVLRLRRLGPDGLHGPAAAPAQPQPQPPVPAGPARRLARATPAGQAETGGSAADALAAALRGSL